MLGSSSVAIQLAASQVKKFSRVAQLLEVSYDSISAYVLVRHCIEETDVTGT
jgi:hypothetical protein